MPSTRYTRIEITPEAYRSLEAEAILQGKTLKKLASELILKGVSQKALDFVSGAGKASAAGASNLAFDEQTATAIKNIGATGIHFGDTTLEALRDVISSQGYQGAMLYVAAHTASMERDELHRVLAIFRSHNLPPNTAAYLVENLNEIESGEWM